jgi:hypothetical protein
MFTESVGEDAALGWPESLGYAVLHGPGIAAAEPADPYYHNVVLEGHRSLFQYQGFVIHDTKSLM